jgi:hypothetical protein
MAEPIFIKFVMYTMATEHISTAHFINLSYQSVGLYVHPPIVARQQLGKKVTDTTNTHKTIEELLDASSSMRSVSYQVKQTISSA